MKKVSTSSKTMADQQEEETKPLRDYAVRQLQNLHSSIRRPLIQANIFEIKPSIIQMIQTVVQFGGLPNDDPNAHIVNFLEICDTFKANGVTDDAIRLRLFPFSLRDKAKSWSNSLLASSINTWDDLAKKFLAKFFPPAKTTIDAAVVGALMSKSIDKAYDLLEEIESNNYQWPSERLGTRKIAGMHELDVINTVSTQLTSFAKKIDKLSVNAVQNSFMTWSSSTAKSNFPLGFPSRAPMLEKKPSMEDIFMQFMTKTNAFIQNQATSIRNLEIQVGQLASALNIRPQGILPSDTEPNPRREGKEHCMAITLHNGKENKLPPMLKDPGSFSIPCTISSFKISRALCDLGVRVSIIPLSIARKLGFQEIQPTTVTLQLADRTIRYLVEIIEDVLLKVGHLYILVDFIVLEIEDDVEIPLILRRPFLATAGAIIDVKNDKITFRVGEEEVLINLFNVIQYLYTDGCYKVDSVNEGKGKPISRPSTTQAPTFETKPPPLSS
ncbi:Uncharacterized protein TCM_024420 [Theobroma cacao]|uniref:Retrotransposon gag domain-containing protein n=1 Tax=Theobroma cacao TaxID=3641 RepID=A0A061EW79_THECC|nr:Uncharacterized protein TCM_024420 [Theobroma cacao]